MDGTSFCHFWMCLITLVPPEGLRLAFAQSADEQAPPWEVQDACIFKIHALNWSLIGSCHAK